MPLRDKLKALNEPSASKVYMTHDKFEVNKAYQITELNLRPNKYDVNSKSIVANISLSEKTEGFFYLPNKFTKDPSTKLSEEDVNEMNEEINNMKKGNYSCGSNWYLVHEGYMNDYAQFDLKDEKQITELKINVYRGKNALTPTKRSESATIDTNSSDESPMKKQRNL